MQLEKSDISRFFEKINTGEGCWEWQASLRNGYGAFKLNGRSHGAHRVSWQIHRGAIPEGFFVCHACDNPRCVNPAHLFVGTRSDNMKDAWLKGRLKLPTGGNPFRRGHRPFNATISNVLALEIKMAISNGETPLAIATRLNVKSQTVKDIKRGKTFINV